jgi:hypothetical protein
MESVEKRIFDCPNNKGNDCPVAMKLRENNKGNPKGDAPIPEAYLGSPRSKFVILGINPGGCENELPRTFEEYQKCIRQPLNSKYGNITMLLRFSVIV